MDYLQFIGEKLPEIEKNKKHLSENMLHSTSPPPPLEVNTAR
jgi:hypothetical protein